MSIGNIIKKERKRLGWSQVELAEKLKIHRMTLGRYERNELLPSIPTILKMLDIFEISADTFLERQSNTVLNDKEIRFIKELRKEKELYKEAMESPRLEIQKLKNLY